MSDYTSAQQQLLLQVIDSLSADPLEPKPLASLVDATGANRDKVFRTCQNLVEAGWAGQVSGGYLLSPNLTKIAERLRLSIAQLHYRYLDANTDEQ